MFGSRRDRSVVDSARDSSPSRPRHGSCPPPCCDASDRREGHVARYHVDAELGHLLRRQRAPDHARRLVVGDHQVELEEGRRRADDRITAGAANPTAAPPMVFRTSRRPLLCMICPRLPRGTMREQHRVVVNAGVRSIRLSCGGHPALSGSTIAVLGGADTRRQRDHLLPAERHRQSDRCVDGRQSRHHRRSAGRGQGVLPSRCGRRTPLSDLARQRRPTGFRHFHHHQHAGRRHAADLGRRDAEAADPGYHPGAAAGDCLRRHRRDAPVQPAGFRRHEFGAARPFPAGLSARRAADFDLCLLARHLSQLWRLLDAQSAVRQHVSTACGTWCCR